MTLSFITICMNREEHLKRTLPANLALIAGHANMNIIVLNYNSSGDLDEYIQQFSVNKQVSYYKESSREFFRMSHAKNMGARLSKSDYVINLDADNYLTDEYLIKVQEAIDGDVDLIFNEVVPRNLGLGGRIGCKRWIFDHVRGYDEAMTGWGVEDVDFMHRVKALGFLPYYIPYSEPELATIAHGADIRVANMQEKDCEKSSQYNNSIRKDKYRIVNENGYGCGVVSDIHGNELELQNTPNNRFRTRKLVSENAFAEIFEPYRGGVVLFVDLPGNAGDGMITVAQRQLAAHYGIREAMQGETPTVIMYCGGGNIGLYGAAKLYQQKAVELARQFDVPLISLPQTWGENGTFEGADKIYVRDMKSLEIAKGSTLMPDMAMCLTIHPSLNRPPLFNEGWFFREDAEKTMIPTDNICDPALWAGTWGNYILLASQYKVIRTNRLHFAIAGLLLGRDVVLYDNVYYKNRSMWLTWLRKTGCRYGI